MKCIKAVSDQKITRVKDVEARSKVATGKFVFVPKEEWKKTRPAKAAAVKTEADWDANQEQSEQN